MIRRPPRSTLRASSAASDVFKSQHSELYFTDVYWPELRELDFLRALRTYQHRRRRFGR
jgi:undecaprenyl diphosphate synthase